MTQVEHIDSIIPHGDSHTDTPLIAAVSMHIDHQDIQPHADNISSLHIDQHGDAVHADMYGDSTPIMHGEIPYLPPEHIDLHTDTPEIAHGDIHTDVQTTHTNT
jgi:hypothetical protein